MDGTPDLPSVVWAALPNGVQPSAAMRGFRDSGALLTDREILVWRRARVLPPINLLSLLRIETDADDPGYVLLAALAPSDAQIVLVPAVLHAEAARFVDAAVAAVRARAARIGLEIGLDRARSGDLDVARFTWW